MSETKPTSGATKQRPGATKEPIRARSGAEGETPELIPSDDAAGAAEEGDGGGADAGPSLSGDGSDVRPRLIPGTDAQEGDTAAAPSEEAELDQTIDKAMRMIHGEKSADNVLKQLHDPSISVAQAVGRTAFNILMTVSDQKKAVTGEPLDEDTLQEAASYVVPELMTVGCAAGIFPFEAHDQDEPGNGKTEFDRQVRLAALEAARNYGEQVLRGPNAQRRSSEAQDEWARGVSREVRDGEADPRFMKQMSAMREPAATGGPAGEATEAPGTPESDQLQETEQ